MLSSTLFKSITTLKCHVASDKLVKLRNYDHMNTIFNIVYTYPIMLNPLTQIVNINYFRNTLLIRLT